MRVLLVEDNQFLAGNIADFLRLKGLSLDFAANGTSCLALVQQNPYDVIVLDVMMPGQDGFETCKQLRTQHHVQTPIIFLTAKVELAHKMAGFEAGGDDYLTKPFELEELFYRIKALAARGPRQDIGHLHYGDIRLDTNAQKAFRAHTEIKLNRVQFLLLKVLVSRAPNIVSREDLEYEIWGEDLPDSDALRTHIYRLRNQLDKPFEFPYLETVQGSGFRIISAADGS